MSVPFFYTHLGVPRGFGSLLNGLAREVLRDQPEDIPKYAAHYFSSLLKQRQESGMDPVEWAASLEDMYDRNEFQDTEAKQAPATKEISGTKTTTPKEKSQTGEEPSHSREVSSFSTIQPDVCEGADLSKSKEKEREKDDVTDRHIPTGKLFEGESLNGELDADKPSGAAVQDPSRTPDSANEIDISHVSNKGVDHPDSEYTGISLGFSEDAARASSPTAAEDEGTDEEGVLGKDLVDSNEKIEVEAQAEVFPHSGCPDLDISAAKVEEKESSTEGSAATKDKQEGDENPQREDASLPLSENQKSQTERPEDNQQEADDQAEATEGMERLQTCSEETHEEFSNMEDSNTHNGDSLVEVSFEDVPEAQEIKESEKRQPEEPDTVEVLQTNMEMPPVEESKEIAAVAPDQNVSVTQGCGEHEMVGVELEVNSEEKEMESQQEASVMKERVDTNDSNLPDEEYEMGEGDKVVSSSDQPTSAIEKVNPESLKRSEGESQQKDPSFEEAEPTDEQKGDGEDVSKHCEVGEDQPQQATQSNAEETETSETGPQHLSEEDIGGQRTSVEAEPEVTVSEKEATESLEMVEERKFESETQVSEKEATESLETVEERKFDSEKQEDSETRFVKDSVGTGPPADGGEKGHLEKDTVGPEDGSGDEQEDCSRPQEEEDIMDIPLDDPEANRAAAKIQAGFRGHMTRKKLKPEDKAEGEERQEDRGQ